jgi:8-oxo-dGTP pyrophosphatase MutT (NUDIX family)
MNQRFIEQLKERLLQPLPGDEKQFLMAPVTRKRIKDLSPDQFNPRRSAVLILLFPINNVLKTVLIQRTEYKGVHSGQVAFPGGKFEETDKELVNTAIRETYEEIGIEPNDLTVLGKLSDLYITPSNFLVSPYVAYMNKIPVFHPNELEVQKVIVIDLEYLSDISIKGIKVIEQSSGLKIETPYYEVEGLTVWGATAMIISELNAVVEESKTIF